jgi:hypothetical protein
MKVFLLLVLFGASSVAEDVTAPAEPAQVRLELLVIRLPAKRALALQADLREPSRAKRAQETLLALVEKDQAELVDWPIMRTISGNRTVADNISEIRYPIEFAQPRVIEHPLPPDAVVTAESKAPDRVEIDRETAKPRGTPKSPGLLAGIPTTFETRNAGITFEAEPIISADGKTVTLRLAPQHVTFSGFRRSTVEAPGQYRVAVDQPEFQTQKVSTNITVKSGQPHLLSFKKLSDPKDTVEIFMLTATVERIGGSEVSAPGTTKSAIKDGRSEEQPLHEKK